MTARSTYLFSHLRKCARVESVGAANSGNGASMAAVFPSASSLMISLLFLKYR